MTGDEMMAYARVIADGGKVVKADVVAFMKALLSDAPVSVPRAPTTSPFVKRVSTGAIHVDIKRFLTREEAGELADAILSAAQG